MIKNRNEEIKQKIYVTIYGTKTYWGKIFDITLLIVIFLSIILIMLESVENVYEKHRNLIFYSELLITFFFSVEYILRIYSNKKKWDYIFSFYGIVDLLSCIPMYAAFFIPGSEFLVALRAFRLLRIFSILKIMPILGQQLQLKKALVSSRNKILVFIYFVLVISFILGTLMYVVEGKEHGFTSIPISIYWCIVTLTTVGYGDISPMTPLGQFIATLIMILGYGVIAVPTGIITAEYTKTMGDKKIKKSTCKKCHSNIHSEFDNFCATCGYPTKTLEQL